MLQDYSNQTSWFTNSQQKWHSNCQHANFFKILRIFKNSMWWYFYQQIWKIMLQAHAFWLLLIASHTLSQNVFINSIDCNTNWDWFLHQCFYHIDASKNKYSWFSVKNKSVTKEIQLNTISTWLFSQEISWQAF